ncbi:contact-dependent growth inhibition system immunity protein [Amorphus suaedae]
MTRGLAVTLGERGPMTIRDQRNGAPPEVRKKASVTAFKKFYRIHSWAVYGASQLDPDGIDADYPPDLDDVCLGAAAREALLASRFIGPDHPDWNRVDAYSTGLPASILVDRFKARAGVKTHGALYSGVGHVRLMLKGGRISVEPSRYVGRGGFEPLRGFEPVDLPETVSDEDLGATIRRLIGISRKPWTR